MAKRPDITDETIVAAYHRLKGAPQTSIELKISIYCVYAALKRSGEKSIYQVNRDHVTDDQIVDAYRNLGSGNKVADMFGVSDKTVYDVLASRNIETTGLEKYRDGLRLFKGDALSALVDDYKSGASAAELARRNGCSTEGVLMALKRAGILIRSPKPHLSEDEKAQALELYKSGMSFMRVAKEMGRMEATVTRFIHAEHPELVRSRYKRGAESPRWKGGRKMHHGYVYVRHNCKDVLEHRLVLEQKLGRPLRETETVHHINGDKTDNRPENLQLRQGKHGKHAAMVCLDCGSHNVGHAPISET